MGQKVHPIGFRLGVNRSWSSKWYAQKDYKNNLLEDIEVRNFLKKKLYHAGISGIDLERAGNKLIINIHSARPGIIIGKKGSEIENTRRDLQKIIPDREITINILEVKYPEADSQLVAEAVSFQLVKRISYRRAMKKAVSSAMKLGIQGIKIECAGRLGGAEIARTEWYREGRVPLHTLRAAIDYGFAEAHTIYGVVGVKTWICRSDNKVKA